MDKNYGCHFSRILISREKREILSHFSRETRKKREKIPPLLLGIWELKELYQIKELAKLSQFFYSKSCNAQQTTENLCYHHYSLKKYSKRIKIWLNFGQNQAKNEEKRKTRNSKAFLARNEKLKKTEKREFLVLGATHSEESCSTYYPIILSRCDD